jgi:hypothetical protein
MSGPCVLKAAEAAKDAMARNVPIRPVVLEKGDLNLVKLDQALDVRGMTEGGIKGAGADD